MVKYLNDAGLLYFWGKVKAALAGKAASSHTHGNLSNDGKIGSTADLPVFTGASGAIGTKTVADARTALGAVASGLLVSLTLPTTGYSGTGPYTIALTATGVATTASKRYMLIPIWSSTAATRALEKIAWNLVDDYTISATDTLTLTLTAVPVTAVSFSIKEVV